MEKSLFRCKKGFTLIELLTVICIIGLLFSIAVPAFSHYMNKAFVAKTASNLKNFHTVFEAYAAEFGQFPPDNGFDGLLPDENLERYIGSIWKEPVPIGGIYAWEGKNDYEYCGIAIHDTTAEHSIMELLDKMLDDGDLLTGNFRQTTDNSYTYILEE